MKVDAVMNVQPQPGPISLVRRLVGHPVAKNTLALYGIQFAGYAIPLLTLPYLARVLHAEGFGLLLFAQSFALWASTTFEYGFDLSATREVAKNRGNKEILSAIAAGVLGAKLILLLGFMAIFGVVAFTIGNFREHPGYLLWAVLHALAFGFSPFWYFQGTERMAGAVAVQLFARMAATVAIFLVVRTAGDGWKALALQAAAGCVVVVTQLLWMYSEIGVRRLRWLESTRALRLGWNMFLFRGASNIYGAANAFVLGLFVPSVQVGYFGGAERISKAVQGLALPFTQAFYPHMSQLLSRDAPKASRLASRSVPLAGAAGLFLAVALALFATRAVPLILGGGYGASVPALYIFALILPLNAINNALIMHWMLPLGMERVVGAVTAGAILINVTSAAVLAPLLAHMGMAWAILVAETCQLTALTAILLRRNLIPKGFFRTAKTESMELS